MESRSTGVVLIPMNKPLSPVAQDVFDDVVRAMQNAEELGGPEGEDYTALMNSIIKEATLLIVSFQKNTAPQKGTCP